MPEAFFWLGAAAAIVSALGVVFSRDALISAVWMSAELIALSGIMASLGAYLLALITMLVYAGAILILFAFVIMFVGQRAPQEQTGRSRLLASFLALTLILAFLWPLAQIILPSGGNNTAGAAKALSQANLYGAELFGHYLLPTQLCAWILLWVSVGAFNIIGTPPSMNLPLVKGTATRGLFECNPQGVEKSKVAREDSEAQPGSQGAAPNIIPPPRGRGQGGGVV